MRRMPRWQSWSTVCSPSRCGPGARPSGSACAARACPGEASVVGVVGNTLHYSHRAGMGAQLYACYAQTPSIFASLVARTTADPMGDRARRPAGRVDRRSGAAGLEGRGRWRRWCVWRGPGAAGDDADVHRGDARAGAGRVGSVQCGQPLSVAACARGERPDGTGSVPRPDSGLVLRETSSTVWPASASDCSARWARLASWPASC